MPSLYLVGKPDLIFKIS